MHQVLISPLSNTSPIRTPLDQAGQLTTPTILPRMVLIGSTFKPRRQIGEWGCTSPLLGLIQAPSYNKPATGTSVGVLTDESRNTFSPSNPNDEGECTTECVVAIGLTCVQETSLRPVPRNPSKSKLWIKCSMLGMKQASILFNISGVKKVSMLLLVEQYARRVKLRAPPQTRIQTGCPPMMVTRRE